VARKARFLLEAIGLAHLGHQHGAPGAFDDLARLQVVLLAQAAELPKARLEDARHAAGAARAAASRDPLVEPGQVTARPEFLFKGVRVHARLPEHAPLLEDHCPRGHGRHEQQQHHQLHYQAGFQYEPQDGHIVMHSESLRE
jgi:hypothetical protein